MKDFKYMDDVVDAICKSLIEESSRWQFNVHTFHKKGSGTKYWCASGSYDSITQTWNGHTTTQVFSYEQGEKIKEAYDIAREKQASVAQQKILNEYAVIEKDVDESKSWWKFWK